MRPSRSSGGALSAASSIISSLGGAGARAWKKFDRFSRLTSSQLVRGISQPTSDPPGNSSIRRGQIE